MSKVALITGVTGQDGSYLAELEVNRPELALSKVEVLSAKDATVTTEVDSSDLTI